MNTHATDVLKAVAGELDQPLARVALSWTMTRPGITSTIVRARHVSQLESNIAAAYIKLSAGQMRRLD